MISALAGAYRMLGEERFRAAAEKAAVFAATFMLNDDELVTACARDISDGPGFLDDYAGMTEDFLALFEATFNVRWLDLARLMCAKAVFAVKP